MGDVDTFRPDNKIGDMLISARSLAEYRAMFALSDSDLKRSMLDCPGGAASFTAEVTNAGGHVTACDPIYSLSTERIEERSTDDIWRARAYQQTNPHEYVWAYFESPERYITSRSASVATFCDHRDSSPEHYINAALPELPFDPQAFDLALSSHLMFAYADRFDHGFHLRSIHELIRVATEVRVFPLVPFGFSENPMLAGLIDQLNRTGLAAEVRAVDYELQRGGNAMLRVVRR